MFKCKICNIEIDQEVIDFGYHPVSHHYLKSNTRNEPQLKIPIRLFQCSNCGTIQLKDLNEIEYYNIQYSWVKQNEPESHLDDLVNNITSLSGVDRDSIVWGLTYKDKSTVERFKKIGFKNCRTLYYEENISSENQSYNISQIQSFIDNDLIYELQNKYGFPKVVICRHLLEHAFQPDLFFRAIEKLVSDGCYVIIEIPECARLINKLDYTMLWEEHITYFTQYSLQVAIELRNLSIMAKKIYSYPYEDCLIIILSEKDNNVNLIDKSKDKLNKMILDFNHYRESFIGLKSKIQLIFQSLREDNNKIAVYGSGHIASTFLNTFELNNYIEFVVDDDKNKADLLMPGSALPIKSSKQLHKENINICLLAMNYENEKKVRSQNQQFIDNGGIFLPISTQANNNIYNMT